MRIKSLIICLALLIAALLAEAEASELRVGSGVMPPRERASCASRSQQKCVFSCGHESR